MALFQCLNQEIKPFLFFATILMIALLMKYHLRQRSRKRNSSNLPPSPSIIPIVANLHQLVTSPHIALQKLTKIWSHNFPTTWSNPNSDCFLSKTSKGSLRTHDLALCSRPQLFSAKYLFYNCTNIAFAPYGDYWKHIRKICIVQLLSANRVQSYSSVREEEVARLVHRVEGSYPGTTDLSKMLGLYANDVLCRLAFGRDFTEGGDYHRHGFQTMLDEYQELLGGFSVGDFFPSLEFIHSLTGMKSRLQDTTRGFDQLFDQILDEHKDSNKVEEHKDLIDVLLEEQKNGSDEMPLTTDNIKAIILVSEILKTMCWFRMNSHIISAFITFKFSFYNRLLNNCIDN